MSVKLVNGNEDYVVLETEAGFYLKFAFDEIPPKKKGAVGVIGMKLSQNDAINNVYVTAEGGEVKVPEPDDAPLLDMMNAGEADAQEENVVSDVEPVNPYMITTRNDNELDLLTLRVNKRGGKGSKK